MKGEMRGEKGGDRLTMDRMLSLLQSSDALKSALFWPSPRQPPPLIVPSGSGLQEAGFEPLELCPPIS